MRLWAEERKTGTIELLFTLPLTIKEAVLAKFLAAWFFCILAMLGTFPMVFTVIYLGKPDIGVIVMGYIGCFLLSSSFIAIGSFFSALTKNQVVSFILSVLFCYLLMMAGSPPLLRFLSSFLPQFFVDVFESLSLLSHFEGLGKGVLKLGDIWFFLFMVFAWLYGTVKLLELKKAQLKGIDMNKKSERSISIILSLICGVFIIYLGSGLLSRIKIDVTENNLYSLSDGSKKIIRKINKPLRMKLFYSKTAAQRGTEGIRAFNNYYQYIKDLLLEYQSLSRNNISLEFIDPRPDTEEEVDAIKYGLKKFQLSDAEKYFFGLVVINEVGHEEVIEFFDPSQQENIEYELTKLIYKGTDPTKKTIGILSSLPIIVEESNDYMKQILRLQGKKPEESWLITNYLEEFYHIKEIKKETETISGVNILLIIHPKNFSQKTLFAIDQYLMKGGKILLLVDGFGSL